MFVDDERTKPPGSLGDQRELIDGAAEPVVRHHDPDPPVADDLGEVLLLATAAPGVANRSSASGSREAGARAPGRVIADAATVRCDGVADLLELVRSALRPP